MLQIILFYICNVTIVKILITVSAQTLSSRGFVCSGALKHILNGSFPKYMLCMEPIVSLLGHMTVTCHSLTRDDLSTFLAFRQQINLLLQEENTPTNHGNVTSVYEDLNKYLLFTKISATG